MATFQITAPDGKKYRVTGENAEGAMNALRKMQGGEQPANKHYEFDGSKIPGYDPETGEVRPTSDSKVGAALTGALEGLPIVGPYALQGAENLSAGIGSLISGQDFDNVRADMGSISRTAREANPKTAFGGSIAGGVLGTLPAILAAPAAFGAGGGSLLARTAASALSSGAIGAGDAAVRSGGDAAATKEGATWGAALGLLGPGVGQAVGTGVRGLSQFMKGGASKAEQSFLRAVDADAIPDVPQALRQTGPDAMPMDLGPNLQRQAGALASLPGKAQRVVRDAIHTRQAGAGQRVRGSADRALGARVNEVELADDISRRQSAAAKPLYDKSYAEGAEGVWSEELSRLAGSPMVAEAMKNAAKKGQDRAILEGYGSFNPRVTITEDGRVVFNQLKPGGSPLYPDLQYWDYVKRELNDMAGAAKRNGRKEEAAVATQLAKKLTAELDAKVPSFKAARDAYSGQSAISEALEEGQSAFSNAMTPNQLRARMKDMSASEREAFVQGARVHLADLMGTARNDALKARSTFDAGYNKEKLEILLGKDKADDLLKALDAESAYTRTRDVVTTNSETAARTAAQKEVQASTEPGLIRSVDLSKPGDIMARMYDKVRGNSREAAQAATNSDLAGILTSKDPKVVDAILARVRAAQKRGDITAAKAKEIVQSFAVSGAADRKPLEITVYPKRR